MFKKRITFFMSLVLVSSAANFSWASDNLEYQSKDLKEFLSQFKSNPNKVLNQLPPKENLTDVTFFLPTDVKNKEFVRAKDELRQNFCKVKDGVSLCLNIPAGRAAIESSDRAEDLTDNGDNLVNDLDTMDEKRMHQQTLKKHPWSDNYWPIYAGILGNRYADEDKKDSADWKEQKNFVEEFPVSYYLEKNLTDLLSPSEKYDLLVGDKKLSLTKRMWQEGQSYYDNSGKVEYWMGICHGWAPASYMLDRPQNKISVVASDGKTVVNFFPSDIKALASLLWANAGVSNRFIGSRCNAKEPKKDDIGRITDSECFDTNPGTWHMAIVNQIGFSKRSFVMDATYDYEVWNQPVLGYEYTYFNPQTEMTSESWKEVALDLKDYTSDKFSKYRAPKTDKIVGVQMKVTYVVETAPDHSESNSDEMDASNTVYYRYDLELDKAGKIIGGEWYSNAHPDFLWTPAPDAKARSYGDRFTRLQKWKTYRHGRGDNKGAFVSVPVSWQKAAAQSSKNGLPLGKIVEGLIERANLED